MSTEYYLKNLMIALGLLLTGIVVWFFKDPTPQTIHYGYLFTVITSTLLFPISRKITESFFLSFTSKKLWTTGLLTENAGKNGLYVIYYLTCMILAIPLAIGYIIYVSIKKVAH